MLVNILFINQLYRYYSFVSEVQFPLKSNAQINIYLVYKINYSMFEINLH